jgi:hypothetical protein
MYCCGECSLDSEITITAVVLTTQNPNNDPRSKRLREGFYPKKLEMGNPLVVGSTPYKYQQLLGIDK